MKEAHIKCQPYIDIFNHEEILGNPVLAFIRDLIGIDSFDRYTGHHESKWKGIPMAMPKSDIFYMKVVYESRSRTNNIQS